MTDKPNTEPSVEAMTLATLDGDLSADTAREVAQQYDAAVLRDLLAERDAAVLRRDQLLKLPLADPVQWEAMCDERDALKAIVDAASPYWDASWKMVEELMGQACWSFPDTDNSERAKRMRTFTATSNALENAMWAAREKSAASAAKGAK